MARIAHKKSRRGCGTCKRRHVKCDESKPSCINCTTVGRRCAYLDESTPSIESPQPSCAAVQLPAAISGDLLYVNALNQWCQHTQEIYCPKENQNHPGTIMLDHAIRHPFLLQGLLALSSFHLSTTDLSNRSSYLDNSYRLLAQGVEGFNKIAKDLNESNILAAFIFSNVAGLSKFGHLFAVTYDTVENFIDHLLEFITMFRGVIIVLGGWWSFILKTDLFKALYPDRKSSSPIDTTQESKLSRLRDLIRGSSLPPSSVAACMEAIEQLEAVVHSTYGSNDGGTPEILWFMKLPTDFHSLILQRQPEALAIIAYHAPLLHLHCKHWLIGDAGRVTVNGIHDFLGPEWLTWVEEPLNMIVSQT